MKNSNRAQIQISFAWLFAIIVGAVILGLAIYAAFKIAGTQQEAASAETGREIEVLLNSFETGFETGKTTSLEMPLETRIGNNCDDFGIFGTQKIQIAQQNFGKWNEAGTETEINNRYIFSESVVQGETFYVFSKPFEFPFKVSDIIYFTSSEKTYCFIDAPEEINREISNLNQQNLILEECSEESVKICFDNDELDCDVNVNLDSDYVEKNTSRVYFETNSLMYAAVFADEEVYECQVKRLMKRLSKLSEIYDEKQNLILKQGCPAEVNPLELSQAANSVRNSRDLALIENSITQINARNNAAECRLW